MLLLLQIILLLSAGVSSCIQEAELIVNLSLLLFTLYCISVATPLRGGLGFKLFATDRADTVHDLGAKRVDSTSDLYTHLTIARY